MVSISEVRSVLNNIDSELIPDTTINSAILDAEVELEYAAEGNVPQQLIDKAVKYKAAYLSYLGYLVKMERGMDVAPTPGMRTALDLLKAEVDKCLAQIEKEYTAPTGTAAVPLELTDTLGSE